MSLNDNEDKLATILVHVGETRKGISNLEKDVKDIKRELIFTVRKTECTEKHSIVNDHVGNVQEIVSSLREDVAEIKTDIRHVRANTGHGYPAVSAGNPPPEPNPHLTPEKMQEELDKLNDERSERKRKNFAFWLATFSTLIGIIGSLGFGVYKMVTYMSKIDMAISATNSELKKDKVQAQRVVYIKVPFVPDAGIVQQDDDETADSIRDNRKHGKRIVTKNNR